jgi:seryl-tRNA synthetase
MHDIRAIRDDPAAFDTACARRGLPPVAAEILALDAERRAALTEQQTLQARRNAIAKDVAQGRRAGADTAALEAESAALRDRMAALDARATELNGSVTAVLEAIPNLLDPGVPDGADETANVVLKQVGEPAIPPGAKQHFELGEALGQMDFAAAGRISGARFTILRGSLARLARALGQFMLDLHTTEHGYEELAVPVMVNDAAVYGTSQLPKFAEDLFRTTDGRWLIPTAEVPLTNMAAGEILPAARLPWRMAALTECFRSEAGSAGRDTRGMLRQHQFTKVEMVSITRPEDSDAEQERMTRCAEAVLERLGLIWRSGCRGRGCGGKSAPARPCGRSRPGAWARGSAAPTASRISCTP